MSHKMLRQFIVKVSVLGYLSRKLPLLTLTYVIIVANVAMIVYCLLGHDYLMLFRT